MKNIAVDLLSFGRGEQTSDAAAAAAAGLRRTRPDWSVTHAVLPGAFAGSRWQRLQLDLLRRASESTRRPWWACVALERLRPALVDFLARRFGTRRPRLVISTMPLLNAAIAEALRRCPSQSTLVTVIDAPEDLGPHGWIESGQRQHFVCYTERAAGQCLEAGHSARYVHRLLEPLIDADACSAADRPAQHDVAIVLGKPGARRHRRLAHALAGLSLAFEAPGPLALRAIGSARVAVVPADARLVAACVRIGVPALVLPEATPTPVASFAAHWASDLGWARIVQDPERLRSEVERMLASRGRDARPVPPGRPAALELGALLEDILVAEAGDDPVQDYRPPPGWGVRPATTPALQAEQRPSITA